MAEIDNKNSLAKSSIKPALNIILRFSSLGDLVLCAPFCQKLGEIYPDDKIAFFSSPHMSDLLRSYEKAPDIIVNFSGSSWSYFLKAYLWINEHFDEEAYSSVRIYDLHRVPKSFFARVGIAFYCLIKKIPCLKKGTPKKGFLRWLSVLMRKDLLKKEGKKRFIFREHLKLLGKVSDEALSPKLRKSTLIKKEELPLKRILVSADSQHWKKKWPTAHWERFFAMLLLRYPTIEVTLVGGNESFPQDFLDDLPKENFKNRLGRLPLTDLSLIASQHHLCICGNSAWQHIAEAVEVPVISLAGPIVEGFGFSPWMSQSTELSVDLKCRPCTRHGGGLCDQKANAFHACMNLITPEKVLESVTHSFLNSEKVKKT